MQLPISNFALSDIFYSTDVCVDYTLNNPDTLTKYKTAAQISHRVLEAVTGMEALRTEQGLQSDRGKDGAPRERRYFHYVSVGTSFWRRK